MSQKPAPQQTLAEAMETLLHLAQDLFGEYAREVAPVL
jgi:hypothetical protein